MAVFKKHGLEVRAHKAGSREIATRRDLRQFDFAFPAGLPAAEKIRREQGLDKSFQVFFTPMAIASWRSIARILEANGVVQQRAGAYYTVDLAKLLSLCEQKKRWNELPHNEGYAVNKSILVTTTDPRSSNSAAMFLALASFLFNGNEIPTTEAQVDPLVPRLAALFSRQGFQESSTATPFNDYLVMGPGKAPLVLIYEAQYLHEAARPDSGLSDEMVLLYPEPTLFTKHVLVPFSGAGERLGELLTQDPELQKLAVAHGFRTSDGKTFRAFVAEHRLAVPETLVNVIEPPSYEILERLTQRIEQTLAGGAP